MTPPPSPLVALALEIHDALMVVATRGWQSVHLRLERRNDGTLRVAELTTNLGPEGAKPKPELGVQAGSFHGVLNEAIVDLEGFARSQALAWTASALKMVREGTDRAALELLDEHGTAVHSIALEPEVLALGLFSEALMELVLETLPEADRRQEALLNDIAGHDEWNYDAAARKLDLAKGVLPWRSLRAEIVGTYAEASETWLWGWANRSLNSASTTAVRALLESLRTRAGLSAFARPSLPCDERFASLLALLAAVKMDAKGVYPASYGEGVVYLAVFE